MVRAVCPALFWGWVYALLRFTIGIEEILCPCQRFEQPEVAVAVLTLQCLMDSQAALDAWTRIEAVRSLNQAIETITNKSEAAKRPNQDKGGDLMPSERKRRIAGEKEYKSLCRQIQEKLIKKGLSADGISRGQSWLPRISPFYPYTGGAAACGLMVRQCFQVA